MGREAVYITTPANGDTKPAVKDARTRGTRGRVIWWNLERPDNINFKDVLDDVCSYVDGVWVSDARYAQLDSRMTYVPLGSHAGITGGVAMPAHKEYDVCHLAYLWGRREGVIRKLKERGLAIAPEAWGGGQQNSVLGTSRLMLNMHQYDGLKIIAPIRVAVAAAYALPVLTESIDDRGVLEEGDFAAAPFKELIDETVRLLRPEHAGQLQVMSARLHQRLCVEWTFRRGVEHGLAHSAKTWV
jgi:hypothetical protein